MFISKLTPPSELVTNALWFLFRRGELLMQIDTQPYHTPVAQNPQQLGVKVLAQHYLGLYGDQHCFCAEIDEAQEVTARGF